MSEFDPTPSTRLQTPRYYVLRHHSKHQQQRSVVAWNTPRCKCTPLSSSDHRKRKRTPDAAAFITVASKERAILASRVCKGQTKRGGDKKVLQYNNIQVNNATERNVLRLLWATKSIVCTSMCLLTCLATLFVSLSLPGGCPLVKEALDGW
jgi:hypothetical protein